MSDTASIKNTRFRIGKFEWLVSDENQSESVINLIGRISRDKTGTEHGLIQKRKGHRSWVEEEGRDRFFVKWYFPRNIQNRLTYFFRTNRASVEFTNLQSLRRLGVPVPDIFAYTERRFLGGWTESYMIFRSYDSYISLRLVRRLSDLLGCTKVLAQEVSSMHRKGVYFGDLHAGNIMVNQLKTGDQSLTKILFVDFDKTRLYPDLPENLWIDDLARLNGFIDIGIEYRMRFLFAYCRLRKLNDVRKVYRLINKLTELLWKNRKEKHGLDERKYPEV